MLYQSKIHESFTLINSPNKSNKKIFFKKKNFIYILSVLLFHSFSFSQTINPNGKNTFYYASGEKSSEGYFKNGLPDSLWITYDLKGSILSKGYKKNGLSDSLWLFYGAKGLLKQSYLYEKDKKNGCAQIFDTLGNVISERFFLNDTLQGEIIDFFPTGEIKKITFIKDGQKNNQAIEYNQAGEIILEELYRDGKLVDAQFINSLNESGKKTGYWRDFHENGKLKSEGNYENGKLAGLYKTYNKYGSLESIKYINEDTISNNSRDIVLIEMYKEYYPNTVIEKLVGGKTNNMKNGLFREYDREGKIVNGFLYEKDTLIAEGIILNDGNFEGKWKYFYTDGSIRAEGDYIEGKRNGAWIYYFKNGKIQQKGKFTNEVPSGTWYWYYSNGAIKVQEYYRKGKLEGTIVEYDLNGNEITKGEYYSGLKEGEWFYQVGDFKETGEFTLGYKNGLWKSYYKDGSLAAEGNFDEGQPKDKHKTYYLNGSVRTVGKYKAGQKHGKWYTYSNHGETIEVLLFKYGRLRRINGKKVIEIETDE